MNTTNTNETTLLIAVVVHSMLVTSSSLSNQVAYKPPVNPLDVDYMYYMEDLSHVSQQWSEDRAFLPATITYGITFVFGVMGNAFVIMALLGRSHVGQGAEGNTLVVQGHSARMLLITVLAMHLSFEILFR